ncbi:unnamed protein product [Knipowitschia caucasica]
MRSIHSAQRGETETPDQDTQVSGGQFQDWGSSAGAEQRRVRGTANGIRERGSNRSGAARVKKEPDSTTSKRADALEKAEPRRRATFYCNTGVVGHGSEEQKWI